MTRLRVIDLETTGLAPPAEIIALARQIACAESAAVHGRMGVSTQEHGAICQWAVQCINALTGNLDRPGGTMFTTPAGSPASHPAAPGRILRFRPLRSVLRSGACGKVR